LASW